jgi:hypothetical protein
VAESAGADDRGRGSRTQPRNGALDSAVRGKAAVRETGDIHRIRRRSELDERSGAGRDEVGEAAIEHRPREAEPLAQLVVAATAGLTCATGQVWMDDDSIADGEPLHARSGLVDPAGRLMAHHERRRHAQLREDPVEDVEIRPAESSATDADDDVEGPAERRLRDVLEDR